MTRFSSGRRPRPGRLSLRCWSGRCGSSIPSPRRLFLRKVAEGKTKKEALRVVKRRISDAVWRQLQIDRSDERGQDHQWPRWPSPRQGNPHYRSPNTPRVNGRPTQPEPVAGQRRERFRGMASPKHQHRVKADHAAGLAPRRRPSLPTPNPPGLPERSQDARRRPTHNVQPYDSVRDESTVNRGLDLVQRMLATDCQPNRMRRTPEWCGTSPACPRRLLRRPDLGSQTV